MLFGQHSSVSRKKTAVVILTGPPAAGKNTVGEQLATLHHQSGLVDTDAMRATLRKPHLAPWEGEEGREQMLLGIQNSCLVGKQLAEYGCHVTILDFLWSYSLAAYREAWPEAKFIVVRLMPSLQICLERNRLRGQWLSDVEVVKLYREMRQLREVDLTIDNGRMPAHAAAEQIIRFVDLYLK